MLWIESNKVSDMAVLLLSQRERGNIGVAAGYMASANRLAHTSTDASGSCVYHKILSEEMSDVNRIFNADLRRESDSAKSNRASR